MTRYLVFFFSFILALGNLTDLFLSGIVEILAVLIGTLIIFQKKHITSILKYSKQAFPLFLILLILFIANLFYGYTNNEYSEFNFKFFLIILIYILFSVFFENDPKAITSSLFFFSAGTAVLAILYFFNLLGSGIEVRNDRLLFLGENPNSLSVRVSLGVIVFIWLALNNKLHSSLLKKIFLLIPVPLMMAMIIASGSKGSFLLCVFSVLLLLLISNNLSKKTKIFSFVIVVLIFVLSYDVLLKSNLYERFLNSTLTTGRSDIWKQALGIFYDNPFGVGEGGYFKEIRLRTGESIDTHNLFIYLLVSGGFISFFLFSFFYFKLLKKSIQAFKTNREPIFFIIWISMFFIMSKTGGVLSYLIMWFFLTMINAQTIRTKEKKYSQIMISNFVINE
ncbi:O-antigen ligase family protein [Aequorivita lipolytica]|uniref:O-antigen ligase family protein n=1 Tax=Aequorivita lipolytica TaxID=153267 RepID=A0A5C6YKJ3_9FLAO|nr:O-antigen ligase family protein [Aequorivita lipolytica]TXD67862.1 O-antigen ligase family protein [Aequorivita lipolytica]SRX51198.1 hypothetical protein AEQU2_01678 [Aequorivita lipolytica]